MSSFLTLILLKKLMMNLMEDLLTEDRSDLIVLLKERDQLEARADMAVKVVKVVKVVRAAWLRRECKAKKKV